MVLCTSLPVSSLSKTHPHLCVIDLHSLVIHLIFIILRVNKDLNWEEKHPSFRCVARVFLFYSLSSWRTGASLLVWLVMIKARCLFIWKIKQKLDKQIKAEKDPSQDHFLWILLLLPNPLILCIWRSRGVCKYVTTQLSNYLEERKKMPWGREKCFGSWKWQLLFSGAVKSQGCSLSHWEVPVGQTEMLWFLFKMLLYLGNWRKGVSTRSHVTMACHRLEFLTTVKRLNAVMSVLQSERTVSSCSGGM